MSRAACRGVLRCLQHTHNEFSKAGNTLMRGTAQQGERECLSRARLQSQLSTSRNLIHSLAFCLHRSDVAEDAQKISVTFIDRDGSEYHVQASVGENMLSVAHREDVDLEGACEGSLACSTCHVVIPDQNYFDKLPEADDDENDMLDLAFGLTPTSRLGCQVIAQPELDGIVMRIPDATRNFAVDGHRPKPH